MTRDELVEAGARAIAEQYTPTADIEDRLREDVGVVVAAVEPLIRADERERTNTVGGHRQIRDEGRADMCADLRAQVEALTGSPNSALDWVLRVDVLALLTGEQSLPRVHVRRRLCRVCGITVFTRDKLGEVYLCGGCGALIDRGSDE